MTMTLAADIIALWLLIALVLGPIVGHVLRRMGHDRDHTWRKR